MRYPPGLHELVHGAAVGGRQGFAQKLTCSPRGHETVEAMDDRLGGSVPLPCLSVVRAQGGHGVEPSPAESTSLSHADQMRCTHPRPFSGNIRRSAHVSVLHTDKIAQQSSQRQQQQQQQHRRQEQHLLAKRSKKKKKREREKKARPHISPCNP